MYPTISRSPRVRTPPLLRPDEKPVPLVASWHVLWTSSQSEEHVNDQLAAKGFTVFLPKVGAWWRHNGVRQHHFIPMFPGYLFLHHRMDRESFLEVRKARGLLKVLGEGWDRLATVPDAQIDAIQQVHNARVPTLPYVYFREGQRVRITGGVLSGAEGKFIRTKASKGLFVLSIDLLQQSVAVEVDCALVEAA